ncbi:MAG: hypothetical protein JWN66_2923 [Sphingomonas bacterium]|uniref:hypothetical protein n=1 Tax=Sphingomonas bacterium TaxID=1895847 RepID=UPI0026119A8F|nr:hypothetical protein [Sphingomonas bacterium]MDB5705807.1 hypothetical protein [Sphingomonas bacterium]
MNAPTTNTTTAKPKRPTPRTALETAKSTASDAVRRTAEGIEANPLAVLVGGVALGVLAGAVIPRTEQEGKLLGPVGKRLTDTASGAAQAARDAGKAELDSLGLNKEAARDQVGKLLDGVVKALSSAGAAAAAKASNTK